MVKARLDKNCKKLMAQKKFKTLEDLQKHVLSILPENLQKNYLASINSLKTLDENIDIALMYGGLVLATTSGMEADDPGKGGHASEHGNCR